MSPDDDPQRSAAHEDDHYGLTGERDPATGELQAVDHEFEYAGETVRMRLIPPTGQQVEAWQDLGDEMSISKMEEILDRHLVRPEIEGSYTLRELDCYVQGIADYGAGNSEMATAVRDELERRREAEGNPEPT